MDSQEIYLLAELTVLPEFLDDVKGALKQALIPTLQEAGCEGMFETSREGDPHKLVFFEIFSSSAAHKLPIHAAKNQKRICTRSSEARRESFCPLDKDLSWKSAYRQVVLGPIHLTDSQVFIEGSRLICPTCPPAGVRIRRCALRVYAKSKSLRGPG